jgi:hypothetical protein
VPIRSDPVAEAWEIQSTGHVIKALRIAKIHQTHRVVADEIRSAVACRPLVCFNPAAGDKM